MATRANNRIEVDLKLLQDRNIEKLLDFGSQFDASIRRLSEAIEKQQQNLESGGGTSNAVQSAGRLSSNASTGVKLSQPGAATARMGGTPTVPGATGFYNAGSGSIADEAGVNKPGDFEHDYIAASKRIGGVPVGLRQTLGYLAEGQLQIPGVTAGSGVDKAIQAGAGKINDSLFTAQALAGNARLLYGGYQQGVQMIQGPTMLGQQLGMSREGGFFGTGLGSPAFTQGVKELWQTGAAAGFGFNPNYSMAQSRSATQAAEQYGYQVNSNLGGAIQNQLKQLQVHQGIDANSAMDMLDPFVRFGGGYGQSSTSLIETLRAIPAAANAASMNLKVFTQDLMDTANSVAQTLGITPGQVAPSLTAMSSVTGLAPSAFKGLYDTSNIYLAAAQSGQHISQVVNNPKGSAMLEMPLKMVNSMLDGHSAKDVIAGFKKGEPWALSIMDSLTNAQLSKSSLLFGLNTRQLVNTLARNGGLAGTLKHTELTQQLDTMTPGHSGSINQMQNILAQYGGGLDTKFETWRRQHEKDIKTPGDLAKYRQQAQQEAEMLMSGKQKKAGRKTAYEIAMTPQTKQFFQILTKWAGEQDHGGNKNQNTSFGRTSNPSIDQTTPIYGRQPNDSMPTLSGVPIPGDPLNNR